MKKILTQGIIQPSHNAYSSLILLEQKKDGSCRFYSDYRALKSIFVKDRYPIMDHLQHLKEVLNLLRQHELKVKLSKCIWREQQVEYLRHIILAQGIAADPRKIACMLEWPMPKNLKELRGFWGLTRYYRRFVVGYGKIATPLSMLLKKDSIIWSEKATVAFKAFKTAVSAALVLALLDFTK
ncbi:uncharacterized mitochondrial protein AtMg00860-like [Typha angustifolia]|uniref:uncharacterized mitochondrial protein AtMg00860-like n=1 Tax=Typha angustifolia TaxID=59011 RepID=UPI003C3076A8